MCQWGDKLNEGLKELSSKFYGWWWLAFQYLAVETVEGEIIKGGSLFILGKSIITVGLASDVWRDDTGKTLYFQWNKDGLFIYKVAIIFLGR